MPAVPSAQLATRPTSFSLRISFRTPLFFKVEDMDLCAWIVATKWANCSERVQWVTTWCARDFGVYTYHHLHTSLRSLNSVKWYDENEFCDATDHIKSYRISTHFCMFTEELTEFWTVSKGIGRVGSGPESSDGNTLVCMSMRFLRVCGRMSTGTVLFRWGKMRFSSEVVVGW